MYGSTTFSLVEVFVLLMQGDPHWEIPQLLGWQCSSWPDINQTLKSIWVSVQITAYLSWNFVIIVTKKNPNHLSWYFRKAFVLLVLFLAVPQQAKNAN